MTDSLSSSRYEDSISIPNISSSAKIIRGIAFYLLLGSGVVLTSVTLQGVTLTGSEGLSTFMFLIALAPFGVSIWAGLYLWQLKPIGFTLSFIALALQVFWFSGPALTWDFSTGLRLGLGTDGYHFGPYFTLLGGSNVGLKADYAFGFGVNFLAIFLLVVLKRTRLKYLAALGTVALAQSQSNNQAQSHLPDSQ